MPATAFKRLILRAVLRDVYPMVIRLVAVPDSLDLRDFQLHRQAKFLYTVGALDQWKWELRVVDLQDGGKGHKTPVCVGGRGAAPFGRGDLIMPRGTSRQRREHSQPTASSNHGEGALALWSEAKNREIVIQGSGAFNA